MIYWPSFCHINPKFIKVLKNLLEISLPYQFKTPITFDIPLFPEEKDEIRALNNILGQFINRYFYKYAVFLS